MALSDTFTTLGNTIINLVNSRTEHKQNKLVAGDGIQITENTAEKNADICIHPDIEAAFQSVIDELNMSSYPVVLLEDIADGSMPPPEKPFVVSTNMTEIPDYDSSSSGDIPYFQLLQNNNYVTSINFNNLHSVGNNGLYWTFRGCTNLTSTGLNNVTSIRDHGLYYTFQGCTSLTSTGLDNVTSIGNSGLGRAFDGCTNLTSIGLDNITNIGDGGLFHTFSTCTGLTSVKFPKLQSIGDSGLNGTFFGCTNLTSVDLSSLQSIGDYGLNGMFSRCTNLASVDLSSLQSIGGRYILNNTFYNCTSLTSISFPSLNSNSFGSATDQFENMLQGVTGCTVHFPSNLESVIGDWSDVTQGFGGYNTTVLFDLPATT